MIAGKTNTTVWEAEVERPNLWKLLFSRSFVSYWMALTVAIVLSVVGNSLSKTARLTDRNLSHKGFPESYLMFSKSRPNRGYLVDRRDSTIRRGRRNLRGEAWEVETARNPRGDVPTRWLLRSESGRTVFAVPVSLIDDWDYPFAYRFVAEEFKELGLPEVKWTQWYVNRVYHGLYLLVELPFDPTKGDEGEKVRREVCSVRGNRMMVVDTAFRAETRLYAECIENGIFPQLSRPSAALAWLDSRRPTAERMFLLDRYVQGGVSLLPLPVSLDDLFQAFYGDKLVAIFDERYSRWKYLAAWSVPVSTPFDRQQQERFKTEFDEYKSNFAAALRVHETVRVTDARM